ncbi:MAG TPA: PstS family phosphate ABC transporter substrate-binding protein [Dissulfurispiraceae bacterium]|nr:PstS family phosphate ABC transporter substrate-binding protein [Dissulfurispiraceae bacterium]
MIRTFISAGIAAAMALALASVPATAADKIIKIDGSSTVYPISEAVAEEFQKAKKGAVKVTVGISGTGGGFKKFCRGETDIANASRPILKKEIDECAKAGIEFIELPIAYDAISVVVNPKNDWIKYLTVADLKKMWEPDAGGKVKTWKDVRPEWPDVKLRLYGPGADSGTFDYFTEAINGKSKSSRSDFTASEDDNVLVNGVAGDKGGLGYFGLAYYETNKNKLKLVAIDGGKGPVSPSSRTVMDGTYTPLSRPVFIYVSKKAAEAKPEVKEFVDFYLKNGGMLARQVKYVELPANGYKLAQERFAKKKTGSMFVGQETVGVKVEDLLRLEGKK